MHEAADIAIVILAIGFVSVVTVTAVAGWRLVRRVRRWRARLERAIPAGMQAPGPEVVAAALTRAHRASLTARAVVGMGVRRQALWMRRDLWSHVDAADTAVRAARAADAPVGELPSLVGHLRDQARRHDHALVLVAKGVRAIDLGSARTETYRIMSQADMVSTAVVEALRADAPLGSDQLTDALDRETRAVAAGSARLRSLTAR